MLALLSPAKKLDFTSSPPVLEYTHPVFSEQSQALIDRLKDLPKNRLKALMKLSEALTDLNFERYQSYQTPFTLENAKQAIYAFRGDTYVGFEVDSLSEEDMVYAQEHIGILSGLYGVLRPLDLIQPYRLEMGTKLATSQGKTLYDFWGETLLKYCLEHVKTHKVPVIISLASNEYIKSVKAKDIPLMTCHFKEIKDGIPKTIGLFAKRARGMMARFIIQNRIEDPDGLKDFCSGGYMFKEALSSPSDLVFTRKP